ncbi:sugar phosphate isomerase/epimerase family protein [Streptomyces sp. DASNCL29]|uniref:sugar phosphate isomerase/epimerase family protein n=1 Tax=Streptomyces sp. DASNCL29 TaxID=2583819 RepID=UPI00110F77A8|nr:sugar phosphate isomerase/epimerase family protein [Streptomyces sp. DASNCL29]TMU99998.1 sugar phosphate isomerase/epimerase [Streptomyces sp. DASNCL29]
MFRLSYNANGLRNLTIERAIEEVADAGYDGIELSLHPRHIDPFDFTGDHATVVRKALERAGLEACCLAAGADNLLSEERFEPSLVHPTSEGRARRVDLLKRSVRIADELGVPLINFATGKRKPEVAAEEAHRLLVDGIHQVLDGTDSDVVLCMEPEPEFFIDTNAGVAALAAELGSERFALAQDLGHCNVVEGDYLASVGRHLPLTRVIQVEDIKNRVHYHEIPGDGDLDFTEFFRILRRGGFDGHVSVELYNHVDTYRHALRRSREVLTAAADASSGQD